MIIQMKKKILLIHKASLDVTTYFMGKEGGSSAMRCELAA